MNYLIDEILLYCSEDGSLQPALHQGDAGGEPQFLTPVPNRILSLLLQNQGNVISHDKFYTLVWDNYGKTGSSNSLKQYIALIRKLLNAHLHKESVITVPGQGYFFSGQITIRILDETLPSEAVQITQPASPAPEASIPFDTASFHPATEIKKKQYFLAAVPVLFLILFSAAWYVFQQREEAPYPDSQRVQIASVENCPVYSLSADASDADSVPEILHLINVSKMKCAENTVFYFYSNRAEWDKNSGYYSILARCPLKSGREVCMTYRMVR